MNGRMAFLQQVLISIIYTLMACAALWFKSVHESVIWLLLLMHCYTDCREGNVYCLPTYACIIGEMVICIIRLIDGVVNAEELGTVVVCVCLIMLFSRVIHAYAEGDEEIYVLLILAALNEGRDIISYGVYILGCSGTIFVTWRLCMLVAALFTGELRKQKEALMDAPMLPAILAAYFLHQMY